MNEKHRTYGPGQRLVAFALAFVMVLGYVPNLTLNARADTANGITINAPATTGDQMPLMLLTSVMVVSAAAIVILLILWKKRRNR